MTILTRATSAMAVAGSGGCSAEGQEWRPPAVLTWCSSDSRLRRRLSRALRVARTSNTPSKSCHGNRHPVKLEHSSARMPTETSCKVSDATISSATAAALPRNHVRLQHSSPAPQVAA